jgi:iron complex outermembrane recepter protein
MSLSPYRPTPSLLFLAVCLGLASTAAAAPQATTLDAVQVTAADASAQAREALKRVPGASNVIDVAKADSRLSTSADVLAYQPGISAQSPGNEGTKVSIRGSGINRGPGAHASGIAVSIDGLPLTGPGPG